MVDNITFSYVSEKDIEQIATIHYAELPDDFSSLLGYNFLNNIFYPQLISNNSLIGLCSKNNSEIIGYVFFIKDNNYLIDIFKSNFLVFIYQMINNLYKLKFWKYVFEIILLLFFRKESEIEEGYELAYIAVHTNHQGKRIGTNLVMHGLNKLKNKGVEYCWVKTLSNTPEAINFYKKMGFNIYNTFIGRVFLYTPINN
jgi:ribosomal protein S18 acetylase RimI-like enzyme